MENDTEPHNRIGKFFSHKDGLIQLTSVELTTIPAGVFCDSKYLGTNDEEEPMRCWECTFTPLYEAPYKDVKFMLMEGGLWDMPEATPQEIAKWRLHQKSSKE